MTTVITRPAPAKAIEVRELHFQVEGRGYWETDEGDEHLWVPYLYARNPRCPHCGHGVGRVEVPLHPVTEEPFESVIYCPAKLTSPWIHPCGRPMLLVPEFEEEAK